MAKILFKKNFRHDRILLYELYGSNHKAEMLAKTFMKYTYIHQAIYVMKPIHTRWIISLYDHM